LSDVENPLPGICKDLCPIPYRGERMSNTVAPRPPLTRREAAEFLRVKTSTLAKWAQTPGKGPRYSRSADRRGCVWYSLEALEEFLERRSVRS